CGESENQPYCDGSHARKNTGKAPIIVQDAECGKVAWSGCRQSKNKPFCDGTHNTLPPA
ncbi:MAG: CDGSH iron-sulfur domain-containing protein, partial [Elusimicrobia bacterium]|nr:CDGSH iron-sulfur domain-containing protein [Elusimicrobiota bacterium]